MSDLHRKLQMAKLPPMVPPLSKNTPGMRKAPMHGKRDYTPVTWDHYFDRVTDVKVLNEIFRVYESGTDGPICFCLHGGGFSALSWAVMSKLLTNLVTCRCVAMDFRGHGDTHTEDDENLSADIMASDVEKVIEELYGETVSPIILVGHSMGGAIAIHTAVRSNIRSLAGLVVIDVVEGTALEALNSMQSFLRSRPKRFNSIEHAIEYCVRSGQIRNVESAKVSMVGQLKRVETNETATAEIEHQVHTADEAGPGTSSAGVIREEEEEGVAGTGGGSAAAAAGSQPPDQTTGAGSYAWRIDLSNTEKYWKGWFEGLSKMFLSCSVAKMLLLAGVDRLDKELTVGQMQGKFQIQVLPQCGHAVHEDSPDKVADVLATFLVRNRLAAATDKFQSAFPPAI